MIIIIIQLFVSAQETNLEVSDEEGSNYDIHYSYVMFALKLCTPTPRYRPFLGGQTRDGSEVGR